MNYKNAKNMEELDLLFQFVPPQKIRERITEIYFHYLSHAQPHTLPEDFKEMSEDVYFVIRFLEKVRRDKS